MQPASGLGCQAADHLYAFEAGGHGFSAHRHAASLILGHRQTASVPYTAFQGARHSKTRRTCAASSRTWAQGASSRRARSVQSSASFARTIFDTWVSTA